MRVSEAEQLKALNRVISVMVPTDCLIARFVQNIDYALSSVTTSRLYGAH